MAGFVHFLEILVPIVAVGAGLYFGGTYFYHGQKRLDQRLSDEDEWAAEARRKFHKDNY